MVTARDSFAADRIIAIGEAKGTLTPVDLPELQRLEHLRALLPDDRIDAPPRLLLFARSGFTPSLLGAARGRTDVELIDLGRLYAGD